MGTKLYLSLEHSETELAGFLEAFAEALPASRNAR
jgi:hypothetical protein